MIKIAATISTLFLIMMGNVQAEYKTGGVVDKIDLKAGLIKIDNVQYQIQPNKTKLLSGEHKLNLRLLKEGNKVNFVTNYTVITEIRLTTPYIFRH